MKAFLFVTILAATLFIVSTAKKPSPPRPSNDSKGNEKIISYEQNTTCIKATKTPGKPFKINVQKACKCVDPGWQRCVSKHKAVSGMTTDANAHTTTTSAIMSTSTVPPAMAAVVMTDTPPVVDAAVMPTQSPNASLPPQTSS